MKQKKRVPVSGLLGTALRAAIIVLAYQHIIMPKNGALPRGTERTLWWSVKNAFKISRLWVRFRVRHAWHARRFMDGDQHRDTSAQ